MTISGKDLMTNNNTKTNTEDTFELIEKSSSKASQTAALERSLWAVADHLRGQMDSSEYSRYMLGIIFYKYLCEKFESGVREFLEEPDAPFTDVWNSIEDARELAIEEFGYVIEPEYLYSNLLAEIHLGTRGKWSTDYLATAFRSLEDSVMGNEEAENVFNGLLDDVDLESNKLGKNIAERGKVMATVLLEIGKIDFHLDDAEIDILGDAYEYLIGQFASDAGKKGGEFYTPQPVSNLLAKLVSFERPDAKSIYDPTCGSGSLLLHVLKEQKDNRKDSIKLSGQELNTTTYNLARMNMLMHGQEWDKFEIKNGNTLTEDGFGSESFDAIVANPPYSAKWTHTEALKNDPRFKDSGRLAPKDKADFAFVQHCWSHLNEGGYSAIVLPHGVLFRSGAEGDIRQWLLEKNGIHAVIGLPEKMFYGTGIATIVLVLKKGRKDDDGILFMDASQQFEKGKNQNTLSPKHSTTVLETYKAWEDVDKLARVVKMDEVKENGYNLNITRYVDSSEDEVIVDLDEVHTKIEELAKKRAEISETINGFLKDLHPVEEIEVLN